MNSCHPDPRRVLGRCRTAVRGQDPEDPLDPEDPGIGSFLRVLGIKNNENDSGDAPVQCLFDFLRDVSCETICFLTLFGQAPSRNGSKTYGLAWEVIEKVEKNVRR